MSTDLFYGDMLPPSRGVQPDAESESVLVGTASPVALRLERVEHHLTPEGGACIASYVHDRLVGRCAVPRETAEEFLEMELFRHPVPLALNVRRMGPVLEGNLLALVPAGDLHVEAEGGGEPEPWKESVPGSGYDEASTDAEEGKQLVGVFLGQVVRFQEDRRFPDSLVREAADMLAGVVRGRIGNVVDRVIEEIGGSSPS